MTGWRMRTLTSLRRTWAFSSKEWAQWLWSTTIDALAAGYKLLPQECFFFICCILVTSRADICTLCMYWIRACVAMFSVSLQKKFLRVRLASDDEEEEGESVGVSGDVGGGEVGTTRQTKEMEEVTLFVLITQCVWYHSQRRQHHPVMLLICLLAVHYGLKAKYCSICTVLI